MSAKFPRGGGGAGPFLAQSLLYKPQSNVGHGIHMALPPPGVILQILLFIQPDVLQVFLKYVTPLTSVA